MFNTFHFPIQVIFKIILCWYILQIKELWFKTKLTLHPKQKIGVLIKRSTCAARVALLTVFSFFSGHLTILGLLLNLGYWFSVCQLPYDNKVTQYSDIMRAPKVIIMNKYLIQYWCTPRGVLTNMSAHARTLNPPPHCPKRSHFSPFHTISGGAPKFVSPFFI
jgi:hypothetical protein